MKRKIPEPLLRKMLLTLLFGAVCLVCGLAAYFGAGDRTLLFLSGVLFLMCIFKGIQGYRVAVAGRYETVCGTCVRLAPQLVGKLRKVCLMDDTGVETTLRLPKQHRFVIGHRYRFYFAKTESLRVGSEYLDTLLGTGNFLGYEQIEPDAESQLEKRADC